MDVHIDAERFFQRVLRLKDHWLTHKSLLYGDADALCIPMGAIEDQDATALYSKSAATHLFFLGYEFPDSLLVLTSSAFFFMAAPKKCSLLESAVSSHKSSIEMRILQKSKDAAVNSAHFATIVSSIRSGSSKLGTLIKGNFPGSFISSWTEFVDASNLSKVDISLALGLFLSVKDDAEIELCKRAAVLTNKVMKHGFVTQMEEIIDKDLPTKHDALSFKVEGIILDSSQIGVKVSKESVESCYQPVIQSGGKYDIRPSATSNSDKLSFDVIICSLGARYKNYCANLARTYMVDPPARIENTYNLLVSLFEKCLEKMIPGNELKDVFDTAKDFVTKKDATLITYLPKSIGFAIGLEFRDSTLLLNGSNTTRFADGMVFALTVGFQDVPLSADDKASAAPPIRKLEQFSLLLSDTVLVRKNEAPEVLTKSSKLFGDVSYNIADQDEADEPEERPRKRSDAPAVEDGSSERKSARLAQDKAAAEQASTQRSQRQDELMEKKLAEARRRMQSGGGLEDEPLPGENAVELKTYRSTEEYPKDLSSNQVKVDLEKETIIVPIYGQPVPFHVSTIKNVVLPDPDRATYLRINFYTPGQSTKDAQKNMQQLVVKHTEKFTFVKELTYRSLDARNLTQVHRMYLELRKRVRQREQQAEEERGLVVQDKLLKIKDERIPRLQDLTMRPHVSGRKTVGTLEAHQNGLRFASSKSEVVDIMYANIRHALFQPCEKSVMVLVHFHLKEFIMIGKKKHKDIQFYTEVLDASQNLDGARRSGFDPDELDEEQKERELRKRLNMAFKDFCKKVEKVAKHYDFGIEFDIPYTDLGFYGSCFREMVFIQPSVRCLVNLTETPFFVVDLSDIEHVHFERVSFATKNLDMVIIFKDFDVTPRTITAIEMQYYDQIQDWLNDVEITYTAGVQSMNWTNIMNTIVKPDPRFYFDTDESGEKKPPGWKFLAAGDSDEEEEEDEDADDESFKEGEEGGSGGEDEDDDSDDDDEDDSSFEEEDDDDEDEDEDADDDLEEKGQTWDELERDAHMADKVKRTRDEDEDEEPRKKTTRRK